MQESARTALAWLRANAARCGLDPHFHRQPATCGTEPPPSSTRLVDDGQPASRMADTRAATHSSARGLISRCRLGPRDGWTTDPPNWRQSSITYETRRRSVDDAQPGAATRARAQGPPLSSLDVDERQGTNLLQGAPAPLRAGTLQALTACRQRRSRTRRRPRRARASKRRTRRGSDRDGSTVAPFRFPHGGSDRAATMGERVGSVAGGRKCACARGRAAPGDEWSGPNRAHRWPPRRRRLPAAAATDTGPERLTLAGSRRLGCSSVWGATLRGWRRPVRLRYLTRSSTRSELATTASPSRGPSSAASQATPRLAPSRRAKPHA